MTNMTGGKLSICSHPGKITGDWSGYHPETESRLNMGRGMITRPIWKCLCIKLFITYFRHLEKRRPYIAL
jgi:hypothetical protein